MSDESLRLHLTRLLTWQDAHASFESAVRALPPALRGETPSGIPYSVWQLVEHLRLTQRDILDFCRNPSYEEARWPDDYWPASEAPPSEEAWDESIASYIEDRAELVRLAEEADLFATIPHGSGQTYLRELLLVADHNAHHVGQIILVRRLLGAWPP